MFASKVVHYRPESEGPSKRDSQESLSTGLKGSKKSASLQGSLQSVAEATSKAATQSWRNLRAVMAYYHTLRKIKRSSQAKLLVY